MNCLESKEKFVDYMEDLLPDEEKRQIALHLETCSECRGKLSSFSEIRSRLIHAGGDNQSADFEHGVIDKIIREQNRRLKQAGALQRRFDKWRYIMKTRTAKFSVAATVAIALIFGIGILMNIPSSATAGTFLTQAVEALSGLSSIHMKARMRSRLGDNFGSICLGCDFVSVEMWKQIDAGGDLRWRLEKPRRTIVMNGDETIMSVDDKWASKIEGKGDLGCCFDSWMGRLLDVRELLKNELLQATEDPVSQLMMHKEKIDGKDKILLEVDVTTEVPENDISRNDWLENSDHLKVYRFDAETKQLEGFQVFVIFEGREVLVFEITEIEYDAEMEDGLFTLELPEDIMWWQEPEILPDNERYRQMTPAQAATALLQAILNKDWEEALKFTAFSHLSQEEQEDSCELEGFSIGTPFQSESDYVGWFIPVEVTLTDGSVHQGTMSMRNDNEAGRYILDGGLCFE